MEIETKKWIGDSLYYLNSKGKIRTGKVLMVTLHISKEIPLTVFYTLTDGKKINQNKLI